MKTIQQFRHPAWVAVIGLALAPAASAHDEIAFVSDRDDPWMNWDCYLLDLDTLATTRLTTDPAIDNHPAVSPDGTHVVFSSDRGLVSFFDIFIGEVGPTPPLTFEDTVVPLTSGSDAWTKRHPHWHPNGEIILFSEKNRPLVRPIEIASECSVPAIIEPPRMYEGMSVVRIDTSGPSPVPVEMVQLHLHSAWDAVNFPDIWVPDSNGCYAGHPSFNAAGDQIVFSGSIDGNGTVWEVYTVGFIPGTFPGTPPSLVPNSLRRVTNGPPVGPNPIQMSAGAHFSHDDSAILYSSTRTPAGNSLIFSVPAGSTDVPISAATQITNHAGNDYVPEPISNDSFIVTSDLGLAVICGKVDGVTEGPTADLDLVKVTPASPTPRFNLTDTDLSQDMFLIADEVSWFCGLKPNLSHCTMMPRIMNGEALWLEASPFFALQSPSAPPPPLPIDLLLRFNYPDQAHRLYALGWLNMNHYLQQHQPALLNQIQVIVQQLTFSNFPGLEFPALEDWLLSTAFLREQRFVVPSIMYERGIGAPYPPDPWMVLHGSGGGPLELHWPIEYPDLQPHSSLALDGWQPVWATPGVMRDHHVMVITPDPLTKPREFFRLQPAAEILAAE
jgi:hypothetical protein